MNRKFLHGVLRDPDPGAGGGGAPKPDPKDDEIARLKAALSARPTAPPTPPPAPPQVDKKALETAFWQNPLEMAAAIATQAVQNAQVNGPGIDTLIDLAKKQARGDDVVTQGIFDKYLGEIEQHVAQVAPQFRTNATVWRNAFNLVKGAHIEEIMSTRPPESPRAPALHLRGDGPAAPSPRAPQGPSPTKLTEEESYIARNLGVGEDGYRHGQSIIEKQHGREPSPWDEVVTIGPRKRTTNAAA